MLAVGDEGGHTRIMPKGCVERIAHESPGNSEDEKSGTHTCLVAKS